MKCVVRPLQQLQLQESQGQGETLQLALAAEQSKNLEMEKRLILKQEQERAMKEELEKCQRQVKGQEAEGKPTDSAQIRFLKQAVYHLLTDFHAEEQLRAIISILDFDAKERKAVYGKMHEKGGLYR